MYGRVAKNILSCFCLKPREVMIYETALGKQLEWGAGRPRSSFLILCNCGKVNYNTFKSSSCLKPTRFWISQHKRVCGQSSWSAGSAKSNEYPYPGYGTQNSVFIWQLLSSFCLKPTRFCYARHQKVLVWVLGEQQDDAAAVVSNKTKQQQRQKQNQQ